MGEDALVASAVLAVPSKVVLKADTALLIDVMAPALAVHCGAYGNADQG